MMRYRPDPLRTIEVRLAELGVPEPFVAKHVAALRALNAKREEKRRRELQAFVAGSGFD